MSNQIVPYRQNAMEKGKKKEFGLIRAPKPHECSPPGFWKRLFYRLTFRKINLNSLWRCPECKRFLSLYHSSSDMTADWINTGNMKTDWLAKGGYLSPEDMPQSREY